MACLVTNGVVFALGPLLIIPRLGLKRTILVGCVLFNLCPFLTSFSLDISLKLVAFTYGALPAMGNVAMIPTYSIAMRRVFKALKEIFSYNLLFLLSWFPKNRGLAVGIVTAGYGASSLVMNPMQLAFANPNNIKPTLIDHGRNDSDR